MLNKDGILLSIRRRDVDEDEYVESDHTFVPWRSLALLVTLGPTFLALVSFAVLPTALILVFLTVLVALPVIELRGQRYYLTPEALVRSYGLLGTSRQRFPLSDLLDVQVTFLLRSRIAGPVGTLTARFSSYTVCLKQIADPEGVATAILAARSRLLSRNDACKAVQAPQSAG